MTPDATVPFPPKLVMLLPSPEPICPTSFNVSESDRGETPPDESGLPLI